ncbi:hypothetical protein LXL04_034371 [Taraxacum kok-saghyz]
MLLSIRVERQSLRTHVRRPSPLGFHLCGVWIESEAGGGSSGSGGDSGTAKQHQRFRRALLSIKIRYEASLRFVYCILIAGAIAFKAIGSFLFIFGSTIGATLLIVHQLIATPMLYDFYNYDIEKKEFLQLFIKFTQSLALLGGLLFFVGMKNKNSVPKRSSTTKKTNKTKTV